MHREQTVNDDQENFYRELFANPAQLSKVLKTVQSDRADLGTRIDLVAALSNSDDSIVEAAIVSLGGNVDDDEQLLDACGEALGKIWARQGAIPEGRLLELSTVAASIAEGTFAAMANKS